MKKRGIKLSLNNFRLKRLIMDINFKKRQFIVAEIKYFSYLCNNEIFENY